MDWFSILMIIGFIVVALGYMRAAARLPQGGSKK